MTSFERRKTFSREFYGVSLDEHGLKQFGALLRSSGVDTDTHLKIEIVTDDGEETFTTNDFNFFTSSDMPRQIRSVKIIRITDSLSCFLYLTAFPTGDVHFTIDGSDRNGVMGLYHDLEREFLNHTTKNVRLVKILDEPAYFYFLRFVLVCLVSLIFYFSLVSVLSRVINLGSETNFLIYCIYAVIGGILGNKFGELFMSMLKELLPVLEFTGKLSDPQAHLRAKWLWIATGIILPIILNIIASHLS